MAGSFKETSWFKKCLAAFSQFEFEKGRKIPEVEFPIGHFCMTTTEERSFSDKTTQEELNPTRQQRQVQH